MKKVIMLMLVAIIATGCNPIESTENEGENQEKQSVSDSAKGEEKEGKENTEPEVKDLKDEIDISLKPNETGEIMVLMYHNIGEEEEEWVRTPENFKKDLLTLYEKGYRPISLRDYVNGNITTEEGCTPVVITFDDGNENNFKYLEDNKIDKDSAVGILIDFNKEYPDFSSAATFFINGDVPFREEGQEADKIKFLLENGMDIGNHTRTHANFTDISKEGLQEEIGAQAQYLEEFIEDDSYSIDTIALPFGSRPTDESLTSFLKEGTYKDIAYENVAILNVGWHPADSPYDDSFDFESIPRVRASETKVDDVGMYNYIEYFDNNPEERFISDGYPEIITVPKDKEDLLNKDLDKEKYIYEN